jgi:hypothetical protein
MLTLDPDPGFFHPRSWILDPGSNNNKEEGENWLSFIYEQVQKKIEPIDKEFLSKFVRIIRFSTYDIFEAV